MLREHLQLAAKEIKYLLNGCMLSRFGKIQNLTIWSSRADDITVRHFNKKMTSIPGPVPPAELAKLTKKPVPSRLQEVFYQNRTLHLKPNEGSQLKSQFNAGNYTWEPILTAVKIFYIQLRRKNPDYEVDWQALQDIMKAHGCAELAGWPAELVNPGEDELGRLQTYVDLLRTFGCLSKEDYIGYF